MRRILFSCMLLCVAATTLAAQDAKTTKVPPWDARGVGPLPRMGITSLDVADDGKEIVVGTIAAFGDPNVIVLDDAGKIVRQYRVGQQWIDNVAFLPGSKEVLAICTMPAGKAGDHVEAFRLKGDEVIAEKIKQEGPWFFHYGDHSNHPTMKLARARNATALLAGDQIVIHRKDKEPATVRIPVKSPHASVSLAVDDSGWAVVGTTADGDGHNLFLIDPDQKKPVWSRAVNKDVDKAPPLEKGLYGTPTLPDGKREELPQRDEKVWAPLSVAIVDAGNGKKLLAAADYQGWQRWVRSSATMKDDNQGLRFVPTKPTITVYSHDGAVIQRSSPRDFDAPMWADLQFAAKTRDVHALPHLWNSRGLGGCSFLPADSRAQGVYRFSLDGQKAAFTLNDLSFSDVAVTPEGKTFESLWNGLIHEAGWEGLGKLPNVDGPALLRYSSATPALFVATASGIVTRFRPDAEKLWQTDLNKAVPKSLKPWVLNAKATPIVPGVWQIPGGRVESDLGGQRLIVAPDGYILIEGHAGLSFEREWAAMEAVGLDPMKVKYVLATHEHGDHAPGAYLWRVVTGAKFVCSEEMAYTLQHHIPGNTGYGLHPPVPTDIRITKDTELDLAGLKVRALRIPGHTCGSMAWHFEKSGKTFVAFGDLIMPRGVLGYSGSVNFSATDVLSSLQKLRDLKVDYVLPGHGAVEGPENYFHAGIDVGQAVGWGFIKPERPDPRFRITQKNVLVVGWGQNATSAAFGDLNGDGKPDVAIVCPDGDGSIVKIFLNHGGKFNDLPDREIKLPSVHQPHKIRLSLSKVGPFIYVFGKTAAELAPLPVDKREVQDFKVHPFDFGDGNHVRQFGIMTLVARRFGSFYRLSRDLSRDGLLTAGKWDLLPNIDGPYADFRMAGTDLLTSYGDLYRIGADDKYPKAPTMKLPHNKDWNFLAVGDFNGDGKPDAAFLSYGMDKQTSARIFYGRTKDRFDFADKEDAVIALSPLLTSAKKNQTFSLVRDTPIVADWNGDGIDDLIVAHGQSDEVLVLLGGKDGLSKERVQRISLEYRVHYEHGVFVGDFNGDGKADLAVFGYTNTGVGASGPPAVYIWLQ